MLEQPEISVVVSLYNNTAMLPASLESVLSQEGVAPEFIVIDDGLTDGSGNILDESAARDARPKKFHKKDAGLASILQNVLRAKADGVLSQCFGGSEE